MSVQTISQEMLQYFTRLNDEQQNSVLQMIKTFLHGRDAALNPVSVEEYNNELEQNDAEIEAGDFVAHEEIMKRYIKS